MKISEASEHIGDLFWLVFKVIVLGAVLIAVAVQGFHYIKFVVSKGF